MLEIMLHKLPENDEITLNLVYFKETQGLYDATAIQYSNVSLAL